MIHILEKTAKSLDSHLCTFKILTVTVGGVSADNLTQVLNLFLPVFPFVFVPVFPFVFVPRGMIGAEGDCAQWSFAESVTATLGRTSTETNQPHQH